MGRRALELVEQGIVAVFGEALGVDGMSGLIARPGGWEPVSAAPVVAIYDRFPSQMRAAQFEAAWERRGDRPWSNPRAITRLCRDKVACQEHLVASGVRMPELEVDTDRFEERLEDWGVGFSKPRFGSFGKGVRCVRRGEVVEDTAVGIDPERREPVVLQRGILPGAGRPFSSLRVLAQREGDGWWLGEPVLRRSTEDPVVNVARGARALPASDMLTVRVIDAIREAVEATARAMQGMDDGVVELGVDVVLDEAEDPWVIEVNSRPRGRLEVLAAAVPERFGQDHRRAVLRPVEWLARRYGA